MARDPHIDSFDVTGELILRSMEGPVLHADPLHSAWAAAEAEAARAYEAWCKRGGAEAFAAYEAAAARAEAAQNALAVQRSRSA